MSLLFALLFATAPAKTSAVFELGYPRLPRAAIIFAASDRFRIGAAASFDYSRFTNAPILGFSPSGGVTVPMLITAHHDDKSEVIVQLEPGAFVAGVPSIGFGVALSVGLEASGRIGIASVGGGVLVPMTVLVYPGVAFTAPILAGPRVAFDVGEHSQVYVALRAGPGLTPAIAYIPRPYFAALGVVGFAFEL